MIGKIKQEVGYRFWKWLAGLPAQDVGDTFQTVPIFVRYTVRKFKSRLAARFGIHALYLHQFFRSDGDRCLHDHPWFFWVLILRGGYWEHTPTGRHWRKPGSLLYRPATFSHRIEVDPDKPKPWSLVLAGKKVRPWGFYTLEGWKPWRPGFSPICETD